MKLLIHTLLLSLLLMPAGWAASLEDRLAAAQALLDDGNAAAALEAYRDVQVEFPDEKIAIFGIGCAQYLQASHQFDLGEAEAAQNSLQEAKSTFGRVSDLSEGALAANAAFNNANCVALQAKMQQPAQDAPVTKEDYDAAIAAIRGAVTAYETVLRQHPDHAPSQQNLDHTRYLLKELLRNPPEEQEPPPGIAQFQNAGTQLQDATAVTAGEGDVLELNWTRKDTR